MKPSEVIERALSHQISSTNSLVIVAIPTEDDYVNKISSEKVPHMTLLFLGEDVSQVKNLAKIMDFTKHSADISLRRFSLQVDRREALGPDEADTLIFSKSKWSGFNEINDYRSYLLKDDNIRIAYESATQFPEWIPHVTLGYPETPANPDNRDYPGIRYVEFDRIAVWFGNYEGIEFPLRSYDWETDMAMSTSEIVERVLEHHGVLGMKWGHRSAQSTSGGTPSKRQQRKITKSDKKFEKKANTLNQKIDLHNATGPEMNKFLEKHNTKWAKQIDDGSLINENGAPYKKYLGEYMKEYVKQLNVQADKMGMNASGTKRYAVTENNDLLGFTVYTTSVKHSSDPSSFTVKVIRNEQGAIVRTVIENNLTQSAIDNILAHHGVKGMKWGVRRKATVGPQEVIVSDKRKGIKTSGGAGHPAHPDAIRVRRTGQIAKKSGVTALSDKELQDYAKRLQLEQNVKRLSYHDKPAAERFARKILGQTGQQTTQNAANEVASHQVKKALIKAALVAG